jgi:hypothetical protein
MRRQKKEAGQKEAAKKSLRAHPPKMSRQKTGEASLAEKGLRKRADKTIRKRFLAKRK